MNDHTGGVASAPNVDPANIGRIVGPFRLPGRYYAAGALFPTGRVLLWGESRPAWMRIFRATPLWPLIDQPVNWAVFDAAKGPTDAEVETAEALAARVVSRGRYKPGPPDRRANVWCAGNAFLPDGRLLIVGGDAWTRRDPDHIDSRLTVARTVEIAGHLVRFSRAADMAQPRWYPGLVQLPDGTMLTSLGIARNLEVYDPATGAWSVRANTTGIDPKGLVDDYPWTFVMSDGTVLLAGAWGRATYLYDPAADVLTPAGNRVGEEHPHGGGAVLLAPAQAGRVLVLGGGAHEAHEMTNQVEVFDFPTKAWTATPPMIDRRHHFGAAVLPTGVVWVTGGGGGRFHPGEVVGSRTELFDHAAGTWAPGPTLAVPRGYHQVTLLLPDASVLVAGERPTAEVYYPSYFFRGPRPALRCVPAQVEIGSSFPVEVAEPPSDPIDRFVAVRQGAFTHSYNFDQRIVGLTFTRLGADEAEVAAPTDANVAPPGYYLLFAITQDAIPSRGAWIRVIA